MPSSSEQAPTDQHRAADNEIEYQNEAHSLPTGVGKRGKARRKNDSGGDFTNKGAVTNTPRDGM